MCNLGSLIAVYLHTHYCCGWCNPCMGHWKWVVHGCVASLGTTACMIWVYKLYESICSAQLLIRRDIFCNTYYIFHKLDSSLRGFEIEAGTYLWGTYMSMCLLPWLVCRHAYLSVYITIDLCDFHQVWPLTQNWILRSVSSVFHGCALWICCVFFT